VVGDAHAGLAGVSRPGPRPRLAAQGRAIDKIRRAALAEGGLPVAWIALTILCLIPVWHQRLLPMLDTPNHLALVRGWHNFHDPAWRISEYYDLRVKPVPYIMFYGAIHLLMKAFTIEAANKIFLSAYLILFPLSVLAVARALKRSPWLAVPAFALQFNQGWIYGFSSYLMGTAFALFSLAALIHWLDSGKKLHAAALGICCIGAYFGHVLAWFLFGLCAITLLIVDWRKWKRGLIAGAVMAPTLLLAFLAYREEQDERTYMKVGESLAGSWRDFPTSLMEFPRRVLEIFPGDLDQWVFYTIAATTVGLCVWKGTQGENDRRLRWLLVVLGVTYLMLPYNITRPMSWWYVSPRVPALMMPLIVLLPTVKLEGRRLLIVLPVLIGCAILPLKLARLYRDFSNRNAGFMRLVAQVPRGETVMVVVRGMMRGSGSEEKSGDPATSAPVYWHFSSWPMALNGGYSPYVFDQGIPIRPKKLLRAPNAMAPDMFDIRQAPEFAYYLVRLSPEQMDREPALKMVDEVGEWKLYKRIGDLTEEP
jgi:hypothetical protein